MLNLETDKILKYSENQIAHFKQNNEIVLKNNIQNEIEKVQRTIPKDVWDTELSLKVEEEVSNKLLELNDSINLNPQALYYSLKSEVALDSTVSEKELTLKAYYFLLKKTKNKFFKKILKEKINQLKKEK